MYRIIRGTFYILIIFVFQTKHSFANNSSIGDDCKLSNNNPGKCLLLKDCSSAIKEIKNGIFPKICAFQQTIPIICCADLPGGSVIPEENKKPNSERISRQKCREYGQSVFELIDAPIIINNFNTKQNISKCKVGNGFLIPIRIARSGEFPHMAIIGSEENGKTDWICSGALISDKFILTTGACSQFRIRPNIVRLGTTQIQEISEENKQYIQNIKISEIIPHPDFKRPKMYNDIALIKLEHPVKFNENLRPACLPDLNQKVGKKYYLSGWDLPTHIHSDSLLNYVVEGESNEQCNNHYNETKSRRIPYGIDKNTQLCTKIYENTCEISYGSSLQTYDSEVYCMYDVQGILSGNTCDLKRSTIYTNVTSYLDWIEENVWPSNIM